MRRFIVPLLLVLILAVSLAALQSPNVPVFQVGVTDVIVDAEVVSGTRLITGLTRDDFQIFDENQPCEIAYFGRDTVPLDLILLLDVSGSVQKYLRDIAAVARSALTTLQPRDRVAVMIFSRDSWIEQPFTSDPAEISEALEKSSHELPVGSGTRINAAIISAIGFLGRQDQSTVKRRAILVVTDNSGISYQVHQQSVIQSLWEKAVVLNAIVVNRHPHPPVPRAGAVINPDFAFDDVFPLADATGGEAIAASKPQQSLSEMLTHIRARYVLLYHAPGGVPGSFREIRIELSEAARKRFPHAIIRTRGGYYVNREQAKDTP